MRIAQIAPLQVSVPPKAYGGTERVVANLAESLVRAGHDVTLFASGDSQTSARLVAPIRHALGFDPEIDAQAFQLAMLHDVYEHAHQFDIIHSHLDYLTLPFAQWSATPTVITLHGRLDRLSHKRVFRTYPDVPLIAISGSQRSELSGVNWLATIHHSVDVQAFPFSATPGNYLVFVGRISPEKRPDIAIAVAKLAGIPLKIAAKVDPKDQKYFEREIEPLLDDPLIEFLGTVDEQAKRLLMRDALALLSPIDWPEPFGMVFIESLACGTPILTRPLGSAPELLRDGVTGFMRLTTEGLAAAALQIASVSRAGCRAYAEQRFGLGRMAQEYIAAYMLARRQALPQIAMGDQLWAGQGAYPAVAEPVAALLESAGKRNGSLSSAEHRLTEMERELETFDLVFPAKN